MMESKLDRVRAYKARMLASIVRRLEQCEATAKMYGIVRTEAALSACLREIAEETFGEARDLADADARKAGGEVMPGHV